MQRAQERRESSQIAVKRLKAQVRSLEDEVIRVNERKKAALEKAQQRFDIWEGKKGEWRPHAKRWERIQQEAKDAGLFDRAMTDRRLEETRHVGSINLYQRAQTQRELLLERLKLAEGGGEAADGIQRLRDKGSQDSGFPYLRAWLQALEWLRRRIPPQIAEVDDPLESLERLGVRLKFLEDKLATQEKNLRGQSKDIAHNSETQRRKARREVDRLNRDLREIRFGSIHGVRIRLAPVESRERVLRALRDDQAQQLLFHSEMPIDEAMAELFTRYGGGRTGGDRLLEYREYIDLQVEVKRQTSAHWEHAKATQMSTGEAIGVGAAIMMVVLTAWERQARLFRSASSAGTLRFLFLDEANRLSQDNLGVLFEYCPGRGEPLANMSCPSMKTTARAWS